MRKCGECRLCCKVFPLPVLGKPPDQWCKQASPSGCSIYGHGQPAVCREYACYWLVHEEVHEEFRPDRIGIVVTQWRPILVRNERLPVLLVYQSHAGACRRRKAEAWIDRMTAEGAVVIIVDGAELQVAYDRTRYPFQSARDIEVAYLHDQSLYAEELKRLGAVPEDYQTLSRAEAERIVPRRLG
jgi:hypothetical protein